MKQIKKILSQLIKRFLKLWFIIPSVVLHLCFQAYFDLKMHNKQKSPLMQIAVLASTSAHTWTWSFVTQLTWAARRIFVAISGTFFFSFPKSKSHNLFNPFFKRTQTKNSTIVCGAGPTGKRNKTIQTMFVASEEQLVQQNSGSVWCGGGAVLAGCPLIMSKCSKPILPQRLCMSNSR